MFRMKIKDWFVKGRILIELRKKRGNKEDFINQKVYKRRSVNRLFYGNTNIYLIRLLIFTIL